MRQEGGQEVHETDSEVVRICHVTVRLTYR